MRPLTGWCTAPLFLTLASPLGILFPTLGCGSNPTGATGEDAATAAETEVATAVAEDWLTSVDRGEYDASWDRCGSLIQDQLSKSSWSELLTKERRPLGDVESREFDAVHSVSSLPGVPDGKYVVITTSTSLTNKSSAVETVILTPETASGSDGSQPSLDPNDWKIITYRIR